MRMVLVLISVVGILIALSAAPAVAGAGPDGKDVGAASAVDVGNKICPVTGEKIGSMEHEKATKVEYKGKSYNLCCPMCAAEFKKNPAKYVKVVEKELESSKKKPS
jgi:YHS domain-containing protein